MAKAHKITMLGGGFIGRFYTATLHNQRGLDRVHHVYSRREETAKTLAEDWDIPKWTTDMEEAVNDPETDVVVIGLPNNLHQQAAELAAAAGKAVLSTKPLGEPRLRQRQCLMLSKKRAYSTAILKIWFTRRKR